MNDPRTESAGLGPALDAAASALVKLDAADAAGAAAAAAELRRLAALAGGRAGELLCEAAGKLDPAAGAEKDPQGAGRLMEQAMNIYEDVSGAPVPAAPAPEPPRAAPAAEGGGDAPQPLPADIDREILGDFITESRENLQTAEAALLTLETDPSDAESINRVFRAFHTIKGMSAFMNLTRVAELAHHAESLLSKVRDGKIAFGGAYADMSLRSVDTLKELIQGVQDALGGQLMAKPAGYDALMKLLSDPEAAQGRLGDLLVAEGKARREEVEAAAASKGAAPIGEAIVKSQAASLSDVGKALRSQQEVKRPAEPEDTSVRVRTDRLDKLIDMIGELVIAQSMLAQDALVTNGRNLDLGRKVGHSGKIVRELQDLGMSMRMVPLKSTFQKMSRLARDLSKKSGKEIEFSGSGEETEIDRNMVAVVDELLVHMIRNSADHGIEAPADRAAAGKPARGKIKLSAYHASGNIIFEIRDDGKGLNKAKIAAKALEKGLIKSADGLSDKEIFNLIFLPGFSTADKITDVSGRGVGMDVVKKGVESMRGRIDIDSEEGKGCTFRLKLPLTMAITDGMLVRAGDQKFIIPMGSISISVRPEPRAVSTVAGRGELLNLRGELIPVFRLHRIFGVPGAVEDLFKGLLVIVEDRGRHCALLVDELLGQQQVVAKSVRSGIEKTPGVSGGAILGDGRVGLILDPQELVGMARGRN